MEQTTRRDFLKRTAAAAVAAPLFSSVSARAADGPNAKLGVAVIGVGNMGDYATGSAIGERVIALCDIDDKIMAGALNKVKNGAKSAPPPKTFTDWRKMLDECQKDIDVVLISTPDHHHAPAALRAMRLGKHVFVQKPLAFNIEECYLLAKVARETKVLSQMGNQGHSGESFRRACEYLQAGAAGKVTETHSILGRSFGGKDLRPATKPVPAHVHWDEWIGPAPMRDYHDGLHTFGWRNYRDFGTGTIGDMACHNVDILFFALKVMEAKQYTIECLATNGGSKEKWAQQNVVRYTIPARGDMPELVAHVYDEVKLLPERIRQLGKELEVKFGEDTLFIGDKGYFFTTGHAGSAQIVPAEKRKDFPAPPKTLPRAKGNGPIADLFACIKNGGTPVSNIPDAAGPLTAFALTGHLAQAAGVGKKVEWDVEKMECTNLPELNQLLRRTYRDGWGIS